MSKVAYIGRELCRRNGIVYGINFGYQDCMEHNVGVSRLVTTLNTGIFTNKEIKSIHKASKKYRVGQFSRCIIRNNIDIIKHNITIDNSKFKSDTLLNSGKYTIYKLFPQSLYKNYTDEIDGRRVYDESYFLNRADYIKAPGIYNLDFAATWDTFSEITLLIRRDSEICDGLSEQLEKSLKDGSLAMFDGHAGLFTDRGLGIAFLDRFEPVRIGFMGVGKE